MASYSKKITKYIPPVFNAIGILQRCLAMGELGSRMMALPLAEERIIICCHFDTMLQRDRQMDRQTDGRTQFLHCLKKTRPLRLI